jgi:hypothetical protein
MLVFKVVTSITVLPPAPEAGDPSRVNLNVSNIGAAPPALLPNPAPPIALVIPVKNGAIIILLLETY